MPANWLMIPWALWALASTPFALTAQQADSVDPELEYVVTGGSWQQGDQDGQYRVMVYSAGVEHVISHVFIQWIRNPVASNTSASIVSSKPISEINDQPTWSVGAPTLSASRTNEVTITLEMNNSHTEERETRTCTLQLGLPGHVSASCRPK